MPSAQQMESKNQNKKNSVCYQLFTYPPMITVLIECKSQNEWLSTEILFE